jgi:hypothetical protein
VSSLKYANALTARKRRAFFNLELSVTYKFAKKPIAACDTECFHDYWLCGFTTEDGRHADFEMYEGLPLAAGRLREYLDYYTLITYNGTNYDLPMIMAALAGFTCAQLKALNDAIIVRGLKPWEVYRQYNLPEPTFDHVDVQEPAPGVRISLKTYGGRLHSRKLQETPVDFNLPLAPSEREPVKGYCQNDRITTLDLMHAIAPRLELRAELSEEYGIDLRSKSDAQIAESVIKAKLGFSVQKPVWKHGTTFKYQVPEFVHFQTQQMQDVLEMVRNAEFVVTDKEQAVGEDDVKTGVQMPQELKDAKVTIGSSVYRMGIGGLHSSESTVAHVCDGTFTLTDADVTSYYPTMILNGRYYPQQMGERFITIYRDIFDTRVKAKMLAKTLKGTPEGDKYATLNEGFKIVLNGSFGKFGSKYSALFSPTLMIQTTMTGQLSLLMLIEMLELAGIPVVSANTDGIVIKCPTRMKWVQYGVIKEWEKITGLNMEYAEYAALYSRDVNNYVALKPDGEVKTKGVFADAGLAKSPANMICVDAVKAYLAQWVPIEQTILECRDIRRFLTIRNVTGGAVKNGKHLGKSVRWYYGKNEMGTINYGSNGNRVPKSEGAVPMQDLVDEFADDLDHAWYIREAYAMLSEIDGSVKMR